MVSARMNPVRARCARIAGIAWAAPCSAVGLVFAMLMLACGGKARRAGRVIEVWADGARGERSASLAPLPWSAITLGHVIIATTARELERLRPHELVHVQQFERWGVVFFLAYPIASVVALFKGDSPYTGNWFERQAFEAERLAHPSSDAAQYKTEGSIMSRASAS